MGTGYLGTFVIPISQTEADGYMPARMDSLTIGALWRWYGEALRIDGPNHLVNLGMSDVKEERRRRAARMAQKLFGGTSGAAQAVYEPEAAQAEPRNENSFSVTDGKSVYELTLLSPGEGRIPMLMVEGTLPPNATDLWVVDPMTSQADILTHDDVQDELICFLPGTMIRTQSGDVPVQSLQIGDQVQTKDNGLQTIRWTGHRSMSGARLEAMRETRPIRICKGALIGGGPSEDLLVSPDHRILLTGSSASVLFNTPEVLVRARDLVNDYSIHVDFSQRSFTYHHIMFDAHEVIWANGVETESFHPAAVDLNGVEESQRRDLYEVFPELEETPYAYGDHARRALAETEVALLQYDMAAGF